MRGRYILGVVLLVLRDAGVCGNTVCNFVGLNNRKLELDAHF